MSSATRSNLLLALVAFVASLVGVVVGRSLFEQRIRPSAALHETLHKQLQLDRNQAARIEELEGQYAVRRKGLELQLRADNARLAAAFEAEQNFGPKVTAQIDRSHRDMGELQKVTIAHIFAMRAVLRADQAKRFDQAVVKALTADAP